MKRLTESENKTLDDILKKYQYNSKLLTFEEVLCDRRLVAKLERDNARMTDIVALNEKIKSGTGDEDDEQEFVLARLLRKFNSDFQNVTVEILCKDKNFFLFDLLVKRFENICREENFEFEIIKGENTTFDVKGFGALDILSQESGRHRGIKAGESEDIFVFVSSKIEVQEFSFGETDIRVDIFHASGAGGQNVNKVATAVRITHLKTRIVSVCQDERTQLQNRTRALEMLREKVENYRKKLILDEENKTKREQKRLFAEGKVRRVYDYDKDYPFTKFLCGEAI